MAETRDESVAELLRQLTAQMTTLVHQEIDLAKAEVAQKGRRLGTGAGWLGGAGLLAVFGVGVLVAAGVAGLANLVPVWAAALIAGGALLAAAGVLALSGKKDIGRGLPPVPDQAIESTKEDVAWLKTQAQSAKP